MLLVAFVRDAEQAWLETYDAAKLEDLRNLGVRVAERQYGKVQATTLEEAEVWAAGYVAWHNRTLRGSETPRELLAVTLVPRDAREDDF